MQFPHSAERQYLDHILRIVDVIEQATKAILFPSLPMLVAEAGRSRGDAWADDIATMTNKIKLRVDQEIRNEGRIADLASQSVSEFNQKQWRALVKESIGIDLFANEPWLNDHLKSWAAENADLIVTLEDDAIRQVNRWTQKGIREGWRHEDIAKNIEERFDVSRARAKFIARDQTAKLNGDLTKARQTQAGVKSYVWRTAMDERVRGNPSGKYPNAKPSHWAREGKTFQWNDPPEGGHAGKDFNCRCTSEPDLRGLLEGLS
jgi:SPP1 gp7 family putative phage head morphogenesis protein